MQTIFVGFTSFFGVRVRSAAVWRHSEVYAAPRTAARADAGPETSRLRTSYCLASSVTTRQGEAAMNPNGTTGTDRPSLARIGCLLLGGLTLFLLLSPAILAMA